MSVYQSNPQISSPFDAPWVRDSIASARTFAVESVERSFREEIQDVAACGVLESPLEAVFYAWFLAIVATETSRWGSGGHLSINPQQPVKTPDGPPEFYRVDFTITPANVEEWYLADERGIRFPKIAVEVDGHDFHERTKEQVAYRDKRDRDLQQTGYTVFHFSGSVLCKDPKACAREVFDFADNALTRLTVALSQLRVYESIEREKVQGDSHAA